MPIRPENRSRYPKDWPAISRRVREAAGQRCQGTPQHPDCRAANGEPHPETGSRVVLTTAHMNHVVEDVSDGNLRALCQRCHLRWDAGHHAETARRTRRARLAAGDLFTEDHHA